MPQVPDIQGRNRLDDDEPPAWHALAGEEVEALLGARASGLVHAEVETRRVIHGPNQLPERAPASRLETVLHQIRSPLIYILVAATGVTLAIGELIDASVIAAVVVLNTFIGYVQERKAEGSVRALMKLLSPRARVIRDGRDREIESRDLVPGDVVLLDSGARVPADLRLVTTTALSVDESLLTGESMPARKGPGPAAADALLADRADMAYTGTVVTSGRGRGYVVATGPRTELGRIAEEIGAEERAATPLQVRMDRFARIIGLAVVAGALVSFALGLVLGETVSDMFLLAVAVAVSAVPESLPVILTITLAVGVRRMARRNAILRRLPAVETLGSTTLIGSDKTGTLTENRMTVEEIWTGGRVVRLAPSEPGSAGLEQDDAKLLVADRPLYWTVLTGVLTNEAELYGSEHGVETRGDPTEVALLVEAQRMGIEPDAYREAYALFADIPFEPERQYSASIRMRDDRCFTFVKGAPERVLSMCGSVLTDDGSGDLAPRAVLQEAHRMARGSLRVLAMACQETPAPPHGPQEVREPDGLCLVGLVGMRDPPRAGVRDAIRGCQAAGMRVVMVTGDHVGTARSIGAALGIAALDDPVLTGHDIAALDDDELRARIASVSGVSGVSGVSVFARVAPEQKLRVVRAFQAMGEVVAVTGDGVNDAPALKAADIGIAMGKSGTDVAREAADMVLADDNFVAIYAAVEEGRIVFDNIRKVTFLLVSTGAAEILTILTALVLRWPVPFLPAQLLWLNLVTNGLLDVALAFEPGEKGLLQQPPRPRREGILSRLLWERTAISGVVMAGGTLLMFRWALVGSGSLGSARSVALTTMVLFQVFHVGNCRSERLSVFQKSPVSNLFLFAAAAASLGVHVAALYLGPTQVVLRVEPLLDWRTWVMMAGVASSIVVVVEVHKLLRPAPAGPARASREVREVS